MTDYWQTKQGQKYKARTQQGQYKRAADKLSSWASGASKIGGFLLGPIGNYLGSEIGGLLSGVDREDVEGGDDDWYMATRDATMEGIDKIHIDDALENVKSGNFTGVIGASLGAGKIPIPGMSTQIPGGSDLTRSMTLGDISSSLGGGSSTGGSGVSDFMQSFSGGGDSLERNSLRGENIGETFDITSQDSILGRAMYNENADNAIDEEALKDMGEGWWTRWKTGQLSDEEAEWVKNNFGQGGQ